MRNQTKIVNKHSKARHANFLLITAAGWTFLATLLSCETVRGQTVGDVGIAPEVILEDRYPDRKIQFPNGVTSLADVVYAVHVGYRPLTLDLYLPPDARADDASYPFVVIVHGGGWQSGHTRHSGAFSNWPAALASIANEGFVVASVEYRLSREAPFPAAFDDVRDAIRWLRSNASDYAVDTSKAVIMGGSSGGQLAALVGTACGDKPYPTAEVEVAEPTESACVQGVVAWYGMFDFGEVVPVGEGNEGRSVPGVPGRYLDCGPEYCEEDVVRAASAISWVDPSDPPFLMIHGVDDPVIAIGQSRAMQENLEDAGVESTLIEIPGVRHSFIGDTPEDTINASRQAWDESVAFIRRILASK